MIAEGFTCQRYGFNVGADKFSLLTIENGKNKHYAPIGMDIDFPKPKISLRQAASCSIFFVHDAGANPKSLVAQPPTTMMEGFNNKVRTMLRQAPVCLNLSPGGGDSLFKCWDLTMKQKLQLVSPP